MKHSNIEVEICCNLKRVAFTQYYKTIIFLNINLIQKIGLNNIKKKKIKNIYLSIKNKKYKLLLRNAITDSVTRPYCTHRKC